MSKFQNFYARSAIFVFLSLAGAGLNYLLYPILAHMISLKQFGDYTTVVGLSAQSMGVLLSFSVISVALVKQYGEAEAQEKAQVIQKVLLWLFVMLCGVVLLFSPFLMRLLKIEYFTSFIILALIMVLAVPSNIWMGYLQGHKEQIRVGIFTFLSALFKFIFILLLSHSFGVIGGLWGFYLGSLLGLVVLYFMPGRQVPRFSALFKRLTAREKQFLKANRWYIVESICVVAGLVFLQNYDLNRAKILFSPEQAGLYSAVSVLSNALYYVLFLLIWILLPEFDAKNAKNNRRVLTTAYRIIGLLAVVVVIGAWLVGDRALSILLGKTFASQGHVLLVASLYQISLVSVTLYAFYLLVLRRKRSLALSGLVVGSCLIIPTHFTNSPLAMVSSLWLSVVIGTCVYAVLIKLYAWRH